MHSSMNRCIVQSILVVLISSCVCDNDDEYESNVSEWQCKLKYRTPKEHVAHSFGYCFKDPSQYCRQHAVTMNGCKRYKNMGLYCCLMQKVDKELHSYTLPGWMSKEQFLHITSARERLNHIFLFFAMDIKLGGITSTEEMAAFLSIIMLDTHFLLNMEEHLSVEIATKHRKHKHKENVKYIGRGAIHVRGKAFYQWINRKMKEVQSSMNNDTAQSYFDVVRSPEILLFPTTAFRTAGIIWKDSYSYVENGTKQLPTYKQLANGSIDNLAQILYHLKGTLHQLPQLLSIWKRVRLVMKTGQLPPSRSKQIGDYTCQYEPLCRGVAEDGGKQPRQPCQGGDAGIKQIMCLECPRELNIVMIVEPEVRDDTVMYDTVMTFVRDTLNKIKNKNQITLAHYLNEEQISFSNAFTSAELISNFLQASTQTTRIHMPAVINATLERFEKQPRHIQSNAKDLIVIVTRQPQNVTIDTDLQNALLRAENSLSINSYMVYFKHNQNFQRSLPERIQSKLFHIKSDELIEALCNDPEVITFGSTDIVKLRKNEKRSFILRLDEVYREAILDLIPIRGNVSLHTVRKHVWKVPFDETMVFDAQHNVRDSLNIRDNHSRFKGKDVVIKVNQYVKNKGAKLYFPASFDVLVQLQGVDDENEIDMRMIKPDTGVIELDAVSDFALSHRKKSPMELLVAYLQKSSLKHYKICCIVAICLLTLSMLLYFPHTLIMVNKIKHHFKQFRSQLDEYHPPDRATCRVCSQQLSPQNDEHSLFYRDNMGFQEYAYARDVKKSPKRPFIIPQDKFKPKCKACLQRMDMLILTVLHFIRLVLLIIFEALLVDAVLRNSYSQTECKVLSGGFSFLINLTMLLCLTEMLCYTGLKETARKRSWWLSVFVYCLAMSLTTELTRGGEGRENCWPIDDNLQGRIILSSVSFISLKLLLISVYYFLLNGREMVTKTGYTSCLVVVVIFLVLVFNLLGMVLKGRWAFIVAFICANIFLVLLVFFFTLAVQAKTQHWSIYEFFTLKQAKGQGTELLKVQKKSKESSGQADDDETTNVAEVKRFKRGGSQRESFKMRNPDGQFSKQPSIKKVSLIPRNRTQTLNNEQADQASSSVPTYTIESIFCPSTTSLDTESSSTNANDYDEAFEIIVRTKRPRSASANNTAAKHLDAGPKSFQQHHSADVYTASQKAMQQENPLESFNVSKFVTSVPPVISFHHDENTNQPPSISYTQPPP